MARTIAEIKQDMTTAFISNSDIKVHYSLVDGKTFEDQFSKSSIESIFFFVVAVSIWTLEKLFDIHKSEVDTELSNRKPHRLKWYRDKVLAFQKDYLLPSDTDTYTVIDEAAKVVKYAAAVETPDSSKLLIKVAGESGGVREKLPDGTAAQLYAYLQQIKDVGVRIDLINQRADYFKAEVDIYYNALLQPDMVKANVKSAIIGYIENLPFNGEFSNMAFIDVLQKVEGVVIPELLSSYSKPAENGYNFAMINAKLTPAAGYMKVYNDSDLTINLKAYELAQD